MTYKNGFVVKSKDQSEKEADWIHFKQWAGY